MWKRDEAVRTPQPAATSSTTAHQAEPAKPVTVRQQEKGAVNIGKSVIIKGELSGSEDLTIEGQVEGKIELRENILTIGPNGRIKAAVFAKSIVVEGQVTGDVTATERVDIRDNGSVDGDLVSPRVAIADGAHFRGAIDMQRQGGKAATAETKTESRPAASAATPAAASAAR
jgi:cytoskeletal protein CcmA (bactofilin family)